MFLYLLVHYIPSKLKIWKKNLFKLRINFKTNSNRKLKRKIVIIKFALEIPASTTPGLGLHYRVTLHFDFSSLVYGLYTLCFSGTNLNWWLANKNVFIFACHLVLYLYACAVENPVISVSVYQKSKQCLQTINGWRKLKRSVVL